MFWGQTPGLLVRAVRGFLKAQARERRARAELAWMIGAAVGMNKPPDFKRWMRAWGDSRPARTGPMTAEQIENVFDGLVRATSRSR